MVNGCDEVPDEAVGEEGRAALVHFRWYGGGEADGPFGVEEEEDREAEEKAEEEC